MVKPGRLPAGRSPETMAFFPEGNCYLNLAGDYHYMERAYYNSQDYEAGDRMVHPTCEEMLDAYITPVFLEKAKLAGLKVPSYYISNGYFEPPVVIDPVNPFQIKPAIVYKTGREQSIARSMTRNHTYAVCCQEIKQDSRVVSFKSVLGWCYVKAYRSLSNEVWQVFGIPLATIRVIRESNGDLLLSNVSPLPPEKLTGTERRYLEERVQWQK